MRQGDLEKTDSAPGRQGSAGDDGIPEGNGAQAPGGPVSPGLQKGWGNSIWLDIVALIGVFLVANLAGGLIGRVLVKLAGSDPQFVTFVSYVTAFVLTIIFAVWQRMRRGYTKPLLRFSLKKVNPGLILWGLVLVIITSVVIEPLLGLFPAEYLEGLKDVIGTGGWAIMTSIVAAPILEEVLFRGLVQQSLTEKLGGWRGVLVASAVFGIVHVIPQQVINAFFIGLILGYIYIKTRSLMPVILIHAVNNAVAFIQMVIFGDEELMTTRQLIGSDAVYWTVYGASCVVLVVSAISLWRQLRNMPANAAARA